MMKSASAPRRVYNRNGITCVCFEGKTYGVDGSNTNVNLGEPVTIERVKSNGGRARIKVTQVAHEEVWPSVKVPRKPRA